MAYFDIDRLFALHMCIVLFYGYNIAGIAIPFAFLTFSVHRLFSLIYYMKPFFKTKKWLALCLTSQWIIELIVSLPFLFRLKESYCTNELWMRIYTCVMTVFVPLLINIIVNIRIFHYVRLSTRRIRPQRENTINIQQLKISRRDISLFRQMIIIFVLFIAGWAPIYLSVLIDKLIYIPFLVVPFTVLFGELCLLGIMIHMLRYDYKLRRYLLNKIRLLLVL